MDVDVFAHIVEKIANIGLWKLFYLGSGFYLLTLFKGVIIKLVNKLILFLDKDIDVGRVIKIGDVHGIIRKMGFSETTIENDKYNWKIPNDVLLKSTKGFPIPKKEEDKEEDGEDNGKD